MSVSKIDEAPEGTSSMFGLGSKIIYGEKISAFADVQELSVTGISLGIEITDMRELSVKYLVEHKGDTIHIDEGDLFKRSKGVRAKITEIRAKYQRQYETQLEEIKKLEENFVEEVLTVIADNREVLR
jgi:hypothetical protein